MDIHWREVLDELKRQLLAEAGALGAVGVWGEARLRDPVLLSRLLAWRVW